MALLQPIIKILVLKTTLYLLSGVTDDLVPFSSLSDHQKYHLITTFGTLTQLVRLSSPFMSNSKARFHTHKTSWKHDILISKASGAPRGSTTDSLVIDPLPMYLIIQNFINRSRLVKMIQYGQEAISLSTLSVSLIEILG